ncbi:MAG TPA: polysaccharide biosynthesis/export family protein [Cytophagaceae bacterium]|jgi:polysaccharide export outer membrane protein|nr:polysaccharide biosynthesis/export family protein [Cytophagaceae bacterium]
MKFTRLFSPFLNTLLVTLVMTSCYVRKEYRMFRTEQSFMNDSIQKVLREEKSPIFTIHENDIIELNVYSSKGERIIDPDQEYFLASKGTSSMALTKTEQYIVQKDGSVFLPMVGKVYLDGLYVTAADSLLSTRYNEFYKDSYVKTRLINKRIIVIGPMGGKVIKLENENINLIEAMALYGGLNENMHSDRIRVLRGDLSNPDVQLINLSTIDGLRKAQHKLLPGDIIYIEPIKRVFRDTMTDILPAISLTVSLLTLLVLINSRQP